MDQNDLEAMEKHLEELKQEQEAEIAMALLLNSLDLRVFVRRNLVKGGKITAHKAARFLLACLYPTSNSPVALPNLKERLLDVILDLMPDIVDDVENKHGFNQIMVLLSHCWEVNPEKAHRTLIHVVNTVGIKLHDHRSPFYNLLRCHFGLYGFPLELDLFVPLRELSLATTSDTANPTPSAAPTVVNASSKAPAAEIANTASLVNTNPSAQSQASSQPSQTSQVTPIATGTQTVTVPSQIGPIFVISETKKLLEQQLLQASHDFGVKRRALTTLLEEITIAGDSYANHDRSVLSAYNDCNNAQMHYYRVFKKLKKLSPKNVEDDDDDSSDSDSDEEDDKDSDEDDEDDEDQVKLTRWTYIVQSLLSQLNRSEVELEHSNELLYDLFSHLIVFGTPLVRKEAIAYLSSHLNTQVPFPATVLRMWFSKDTDSTRLINLFPQQIVFEALQEVMVQDRVRFFYVDNLFSLLEDEISLHQFEWHQYGPSSGHPGQTDLFELTSPRGSSPGMAAGGHFGRPLDSSSGISATKHQSSSPVDHNFPTDFEIDESAIDVPLVSWLLLLLSNTMHRVSDNAPIHKGSKCRNCNMSPIYGVRYRCVNCVDYDLCETCEADVATRHNKLHLFLKIPAALPLPPSSFHGLPAPKEPLLPLLYKRGNNASSSMSAQPLQQYQETSPSLPPPSSSASGTGGGVSTSFFLSIMNQQKSDLHMSGLTSGMLPDAHGGYMKPTPEVGPAFMGPAFSSVGASPAPISKLSGVSDTPLKTHGAAISGEPQILHDGQSGTSVGSNHTFNVSSTTPTLPSGGALESLKSSHLNPALNAAVLAGNASGNTTPGPFPKPGAQKSPQTQASPSAAPITEIHRGIACDGCGRSSITGVRYKCVHCDEFNLCDSCEGTVEHYPLHLFLKVRRPLPPSAQASRQQRRQSRHHKRRHHQSSDKAARAENSGTDDIDLSKALIPVLLHHAFYPSTSYKASVPALSPGSRIKLSKSVTDLTSFAKEETSRINAGANFLAPGAISLRSSLVEIVNDHTEKMIDSLATPDSSKPIAGSDASDKKAPFGLPRLEEVAEPRSDAVSMVGNFSELQDYTQGPGYQVFDGRHLRSIFGVIMLSARLQTLGPELFLLAMRVLEGLTTQYTPDDIAADVFNHSHFDDFLRQVASYPSSFIRSAVLQMVDKLVNSTAYVVGKEGVHALKRIRTPLRAKAIKLLRESESAPNTASVHSSDNFLLELLLVVTSDKDIIKSEHPSSLSAPADDDQYPLDSIANYLVQFLADGDDMPLGSSTAARTWCMVFRLLRFADPNHVGRIPQLTRAIRQAMTAPEELQVLLVDDFIALLTVLVSKPGLGPIVQASIMGEIAKAFPEAYYEDNTLALSHAIAVMHEHFTADVEFNLSDISDILQVLADALPESLPTFYPKDDPGNRMMKELVDYLIMILSSSAFTEAHIAELIETAIQERDKAFSQLVITWLSLIEPKSKQKATAALRRDDESLKSASSGIGSTQSAMSAISFSGISTPLHPTAQPVAVEAPAKINAVTIFDLGRSFTRLVKVMCTNDFVTKHFLSLALASLRTKANSVLLAELCLSLIRTEDLAYYFLIELEGFDFFEDQIKNANTKFRSSFLAPAFASILSATTTAFKEGAPLSGGPSTLNQRMVANAAARQKIGNNRKPNKSNLENLSSVAELLHPRGDRQLERLLKESGAPTTSVWMHNFKPSGGRSIAVHERVTFDMSMPDNVILREIRMDFVSNHNGSKFPPHVTIETGTSLSRLLPVGRFSCKPDASMYAQQASKATKHVATFKFPLPDIEVVKFVRVHIQRPKQSTWLALSRLQLLGHSSLLYNVNTSADNAATDGSQPSLVHRLPITTCLDILEHAISFPRVNYALALQKNNTPQFGINLLYILNKSTFTSVQSITSNLAQNDTSLSDFLLNELLEGQTVYHAALAGKLCALSDSETNNRLSKLRDFVFQQLDRHTSTSLSSHLVPFLDALSDAISSNIQQDSEVKCEVSQPDIKLLFQCAITALDGSLLQKGALRLLSSLIQTDAHNYDVILAFFYSILQETLASIAEQQQEAAQAAQPTSITPQAPPTTATPPPSASSVPTIVISSGESPTTPVTNTVPAKPSTSATSAPRQIPFKVGTALPLPHVTTQHDIFQLFVDKSMQTIISTLGLLASSSPAASHSLMRSGLPERIVQTVRTILQIREEKQQQKAAAAQSTLSNSSQALSSANLAFVPVAQPQTDPHRPRGEILTLQRILEASLAFLSNMAHEQSLKTWLGENAFEMLFDLLKREHGSSLIYAAQQVFRASANLHPVNQSKIAQYVLNQLRRQQEKLSCTLSTVPCPDSPANTVSSASSAPYPSTDAIGTQKRPSGVTASLISKIEDLLGWNGHSVLSETTIQQLVDMFSIEDRVVLSLHPKNGAEDEVKALGPQSLAPGSLYAPTRQETIRLDKTVCNPNLELDEDLLTVTASSSTLTGWRTVLADRPIVSGVRRWEVVLERITTTANVMIGVCEKNHKLNAYLGQNYGGKGWSYYGATTGFTYHDGKSDSKYGQKMLQGDVIGVCLDLNEGTLSFSRNGEDLGTAFKDIASRELYPAISLYDAGDQVRFQELEGAPVDKGPLSAARIEGISPLIYQRNGPLFSLPTSTSLKSIALSLTGTDSSTSSKVVIFEFINRPVDPTVHHVPSSSAYSHANAMSLHPHSNTAFDEEEAFMMSAAMSVATGRSDHGSMAYYRANAGLMAVWDHEETLSTIFQRFGSQCEILDVYFEIVPRSEATVRQFAENYSHPAKSDSVVANDDEERYFSDDLGRDEPDFGMMHGGRNNFASSASSVSGSDDAESHAPHAMSSVSPTTILLTSLAKMAEKRAESVNELTRAQQIGSVLRKFGEQLGLSVLVKFLESQLSALEYLDQIVSKLPIPATAPSSQEKVDPVSSAISSMGINQPPSAGVSATNNISVAPYHAPTTYSGSYYSPASDLLKMAGIVGSANVGAPALVNSKMITIPKLNSTSTTGGTLPIGSTAISTHPSGLSSGSASVVTTSTPSKKAQLQGNQIPTKPSISIAIATWKNWLSFLLMQLKVKDFNTLFISNFDCRALLFKVLTDIQMDLRRYFEYLNTVRNMLLPPTTSSSSSLLGSSSPNIMTGTNSLSAPSSSLAAPVFVLPDSGLAGGVGSGSISGTSSTVSSSSSVSAASSALKVASAATKIGLKIESVPPPSDEALAQPYKPLYRALITLMCSHQGNSEQGLAQRQSIFESGVLSFILVELVKLCDYMPRNVEHPAFQAIVALKKLQNQKMRDAAASSVRKAHASSDQPLGPAKGTGFGSDSADLLPSSSSWTPESYIKEQSAISQKTAILLECVHTFLELMIEDDSITNTENGQGQDQGTSRSSPRSRPSKSGSQTFTQSRSQGGSQGPIGRMSVGTSVTTDSVAIEISSDRSDDGSTRASSSRRSNAKRSSSGRYYRADVGDSGDEEASFGGDDRSSGSNSDGSSSEDDSSSSTTTTSDSDSMSSSDLSSDGEMFGNMEDVGASPRNPRRSYHSSMAPRFSKTGRRRKSKQRVQEKRQNNALANRRRNRLSFDFEDSFQSHRLDSTTDSLEFDELDHLELMEEMWDEVIEQEGLVSQPCFPASIYELIASSNLVSVIESHLRNDTLLDMVPHMEVYEAVVRCTNALLVHEPLVPLIIPADTHNNIFQLLSKLAAMSDIILKRIPQSLFSGIGSNGSWFGMNGSRSVSAAGMSRAASGYRRRSSSHRGVNGSNHEMNSSASAKQFDSSSNRRLRRQSTLASQGISFNSSSFTPSSLDDTNHPLTSSYKSQGTPWSPPASSSAITPGEMASHSASQWRHHSQLHHQQGPYSTYGAGGGGQRAPRSSRAHLDSLRQLHAQRQRRGNERRGESSTFPMPVYISPTGSLFVFGLEIDNEIRLALEWRKTYRSALFFVEQMSLKRAALAQESALFGSGKHSVQTTGNGSLEDAAVGPEGRTRGVSTENGAQAQYSTAGGLEDEPNRQQWRGSAEWSPSSSVGGHLTPEEEYTRVMAPHAWGEVDMYDPEQDTYWHHFRALIKSETAPSAKKSRALVREATALASSLPLYLASSVFFRIDESRMDVMKCIITGPEDTPYAHGCFLFDIYCSNEFPSVPPQVNLQTTGNGTVRFNPNLYNCGKVCLSLLGTWRGGPNEQWNEATTTLLQVFVSIQSLIFVSEPFFNEPGYETLMNTTKGDLQSAAYNEPIRLATITFAMLDALRNPPLGFEQVIKLHFSLKANRVMKDVVQWLEEAVTSHAAPDFFAKLKASILELKDLLLQLNPDAMDGITDPNSIQPPAKSVLLESGSPSKPAATPLSNIPSSSSHFETTQALSEPLGDDGYTHPTDIYPHLSMGPKPN
jgi:ubiquitin-protein ligase